MSKLKDLIPAGLHHTNQAETARELSRVKNPPRGVMPYIAAGLCSLALLLGANAYTPAYVLQAGDTELGLVRNHALVDTTVTQVESQISEILGRDYTMDLDLHYQPILAPKDDVMGYAQLTQVLYDESPDVQAAYILSVDGVEISAAEEPTVFDEALADLEARYTTKDTQEIFFANETRVTRKYIPAEKALADRNDVVNAALAPKKSAGTQEQPVAAIARVYDMSEGSFLAEGAVFEDLASDYGTMVAVEHELPQLSVCTIDHIVYTEVIESPVREVPDPEMYEDETRLVTEGTPGLLRTESDVTSLNGERLYEDVTDQRVLLEAEETVVAYGTMERPAYMGTGDFRWPCQGSVTSSFGYRYIFGSTSFHTGIDIANSNGTAIYAADSGIVSFAGYQGSYGNLIIIDHGNGYQTAYAHCDSISVSVGQGVLQGDYIAAMGATGRATGNHCHFEVRENGEQINPQFYLS